MTSSMRYIKMSDLLPGDYINLGSFLGLIISVDRVTSDGETVLTIMQSNNSILKIRLFNGASLLVLCRST